MPKKVVAKTQQIVFDKTKLSVVPIDKVRPNTWNPKESDTIEYQRIKLGIQQHGLRKPIVVRENDGYEIIDGEQRWKICQELNYKKIPIYNEGELSDKEAKELTIIYEHQVPFEPINFMVLIKELDDMYEDVEIGYSRIDIDSLLQELKGYQAGGGVKEDDFDPDDVLDEEPITQTGDLWHLGGHRLLCGDSTKAKDIEKLMNGEKAVLIVSSPPYFNQREYSIWENYEAYLSFAHCVVENIDIVVGSNAIIAWNIGSDEPAHRWMPSDWWCLFRDTGWNYQESIAWVKAAAVWSVPRSMHIENGRYFPALRWEICLVMKKGKHPIFDISDKARVREFQDNVWEIAVVSGQIQQKEGHPAMYPVELPARFITAYTQSRQLVYDPFLGSGTTLIAAEQLDRLCYGMEIEPKYCDVIVKRYINHIGASDNVFVERDGKKITWDEFNTDTD